jgi:hypothetical protein
VNRKQTMESVRKGDWIGVAALNMIFVLQQQLSLHMWKMSCFSLKLFEHIAQQLSVISLLFFIFMFITLINLIIADLGIRAV